MKKKPGTKRQRRSTRSPASRRRRTGQLPIGASPTASLSHVTGSGANVFADLGFPPEQAENLKVRSDLMSEAQRLVAGMTPAKVAATLAVLTPVEILQAMQKLRVRRTPSIQAHVTNRVDHPLLIAADAASAVAHGFRELETTVPVLRDAPDPGAEKPGGLATPAPSVMIVPATTVPATTVPAATAPPLATLTATISATAPPAVSDAGSGVAGETDFGALPPGNGPSVNGSFGTR